MDSRTESRVLGLISLALALFGVFAPYQWREMPSSVTTSALVLAAACFLLAIWLVLPARFKIGTWGPLILIFGGPLLGVLWLYVGSFQGETEQVNQKPDQATASSQPDIVVLSPPMYYYLVWDPPQQAFIIRGTLKGGKIPLEPTGETIPPFV